MRYRGLRWCRVCAGLTGVDVHKWVTVSGGVLPQGGGIQFCRLLILCSMYDSWHMVPDQLCSICLVVR